MHKSQGRQGGGREGGWDGWGTDILQACTRCGTGTHVAQHAAGVGHVRHSMQQVWDPCGTACTRCGTGIRQAMTNYEWCTHILTPEP